MQRKIWSLFLESPETFRTYFGLHHFVSPKRKRLDVQNFAFILIFIPFTTYEKPGFTELAGRSFTNGFSLARKVFGTFEKRAPGHSCSKW